MVDSNPEKEKISSFEQLEMWQEAMQLAVNVYEQTKEFPSIEQFGLTNQIRRAATSISANIAEGFGRRTHKDKLQFYAIACGSLLEVKNFIYLSHRLGYLESSDDFLIQITSLQKRINALISSIRAHV